MASSVTLPAVSGLLPYPIGKWGNIIWFIKREWGTVWIKEHWYKPTVFPHWFLSQVLQPATTTSNREEPCSSTIYIMIVLKLSSIHSISTPYNFHYTSQAASGANANRSCAHVLITIGSDGVGDLWEWRTSITCSIQKWIHKRIMYSLLIFFLVDHWRRKKKSGIPWQCRNDRDIPRSKFDRGDVEE